MKQALADALKKRNYDTLTPVQEAVTAPEIVGADLLVSAQTGSGKTLGFGLAIAPTILDGERFASAESPLALVIAPTRELAMQVKRELAWLYAEAGAVMASCVGGMDMRDERRALGRGAHIVVATPGRLRDHIMRGSIDLSSLKAVVLDEADEMLDLGFREDLEFILGESPSDRQTLLFSATVPKQIVHLAKNYQTDAIRIVTTSETDQHADIDYQAMVVAERDVENAVVNALRFFEAPNALVFANTRATVNRLTSRLSNRGLSVVALSGELSQAERTNALQAMRDGRARVCIATDVAARGIDLPNLDLVVHAELPNNHETLLHRSGRTGRAGRKGVSVMIVTKKTLRKGERILKMAKLDATWTSAPSAEAILARDEERMLAHSSWTDAASEAETVSVAKLNETYSPDQIALAYLRLYQSKFTAPEEVSAVEDRPKKREAFGPSTWFSFPAGRNQDVDPRRLLPTLCTAGDLTKDDIGAIRIQPEVSFFEIRAAAVANFVRQLGPELDVEGNKLTQLDSPPAEASQPRKKFDPKARRDDRSPRPNRKTSTPPTDWNDDAAPRHRKPKPDWKKGPSNGPSKGPSKGKSDHSSKSGSKPDWKSDKPKGKPDWKSDKPQGKPDWKSDKPRSKDGPRDRADGHAHAAKAPGRLKPSNASDPSRSLKGPPPPKGKSNSKKNRARAAVKAATKGKPGGMSAPRHKPKKT